MLSPGAAYLLAYLPALRLAHAARKDLVERNAATTHPALKHAVEFAHRALKIQDSMFTGIDKRLAALAEQHGLSAPVDAEHIRPLLTTSVLQAAWKAGETTRRVTIAVHLAAQIAHLRCAAPDDAALRAQAEHQAHALKTSADQLTADLTATGLPLVIDLADNAAEQISLTINLTPTTLDGYRELNRLVRDVEGFIQLKEEALDAAPPTAQPDSEEEALLARIIVTPGDMGLRLEFAALADRRNDERAALIRLQLTAIDEDADSKAMELIRSHPEWSARLLELGARDIEFGGGFPAQITIDAATLLARGAELFAAAPLRRLRVRATKGRVGEVLRSPLLATIESLDLDEQGVTDDDVIALAGSPHAARLRWLNLRFNVCTERGVDAIAASPYLKQLYAVYLEPNAVDPVDRLEYYDETHQHAVPTEAGKALEAKYGPLRWLRRR
jgi:uncharacterized protein (TIGR02996 family)